MTNTQVPANTSGSFGFKDSRKSWLKWALPGQNNGSKTRRQRGQSMMDKRRHRESLNSGGAMQMSTVFKIGPWTLNSHRNFRPNRWVAPVGGTRRDVLSLRNVNGTARYHQGGDGSIRGPFSH